MTTDPERAAIAALDELERRCPDCVPGCRCHGCYKRVRDLAYEHLDALLSLARRAEQAEDNLVGVSIQVLGFDGNGDPIPFDDAKVTAAINRLLRAEAEVERLREALTETVKVAAMYDDLASQLLAKTRPEVLPGIRHNREFAREWGQKALDLLALRPADANKGGE